VCVVQTVCFKLKSRRRGAAIDLIAPLRPQAGAIKQIAPHLLLHLFFKDRQSARHNSGYGQTKVCLTKNPYFGGNN